VTSKLKQPPSIITKLLIPGFLSGLAVMPCSIQAQEVVREAMEHFVKFNNVPGGWLAADATISLLLPDNKTLWLFGDSFIGERTGEFSINPGKSRFINNSAILESGNEMTTLYAGTPANPSSFIPGEGKDIFWPEHAVIENDTVKVFAVRIKPGNTGVPGFNFIVGTTYKASFKYPGFEYISTTPFKSVTDSAFRFGACVIKSGDHTYIFGVKDTTSGQYTYPLPYLARVSETIEEPWEFYAGPDTWSRNIADAVPVGNRPMSESFYVYERNGRFYLLMHEIWLVGELWVLEAGKITGPWNTRAAGGIENRFAVITKPKANMTYNLFAHPQFRENGEILISVNVNTTNFNSIYSDTRNYRGRFFWLDPEAAVAVIKPDTIKLFNTPVAVDPVPDDNAPARIIYHPATGIIHIRNVNTPSMLSIYGLDGRLYMSRMIKADTGIDCSRFPATLVIARLQWDRGVETRKILLR